jgi:polygalacturonase
MGASLGRGAVSHPLASVMLALVTTIAVLDAGRDDRTRITAYAGVPGHTASTAFTGLSAAGTSLGIWRYKEASYARFAAGSPTTVVVTASEPVTNCEVRPRIHAIPTRTDANTCTFQVPAPMNLEVGVNSLEKLFLFVDIPQEAGPVCCDGKTVFDVTTYPGVDRTGRTKSTGIQAAINLIAGKSTCTTTSICTLYFKTGTYLARQLFLKSKVQLYLQSGAKLLASTNPSDYKLDPGTHRTAFITADNVSYTGISGPGAIDGDGLAYRKRNNAGSPYPYWNCRTTTNAMCWDSPRLVLIRRSHHVKVQDVMMLDPAAWTNHVHYSDQVTYTNVKVLDDRIKFNTDAMDVDASTNVTVRSSFYHGRDDGFCVKATRELGLIKTSRNIRFLDNTVGYGNNATKLGTETYVGGNMDDILVRNLFVTNAARPFGVYLKDGNAIGSTTGITVDGVHADAVRQQGFAIEISKRNPSSAIGRVSRVALNNFNLPATVGASTIRGYDASHLVSGVSISSFRIGGVLKKTLAEARVTKNAYTSGITIR